MAGISWRGSDEPTIEPAATYLGDDLRMHEWDQDLDVLRVLVQEGTDAADRVKLTRASYLFNRLKSTGTIENDPVLDELGDAINKGFQACRIRDGEMSPGSLISLDANIREAIVHELAAAQGEGPPRARASYPEVRALLRAGGVDVSHADIRLLLALGRDRAIDLGLTSPIVDFDALPKEFSTTAEVMADIEATDREARDRDQWAKAQREALEARRWADVDFERLSEVVRDGAHARTPEEWEMRREETINFAVRWHWNQSFSDVAKRELATYVRASYELTDDDAVDVDLFFSGGSERMSDPDPDIEQLRVLIRNGTEAADRDTLIKLSNVWDRLWTRAGANEHDAALEPLREALNEGFKACDIRDSQDPPKPLPEDLLSPDLDITMREAIIRELAAAQGDLVKAPPRSRASYEEACAFLRAVGLTVSTSDLRLLLAAARHRALVDGVAGRDDSLPAYSANDVRTNLNETFEKNRTKQTWAVAQRQALAERRWADLDVNGLLAFLTDGLPPVLSREEQEEQVQEWINFVVSSGWDRLASKELKRRLSQGLHAFYGDDDEDAAAVTT